MLGTGHGLQEGRRVPGRGAARNPGVDGSLVLPSSLALRLFETPVEGASEEQVQSQPGPGDTPASVPGGAGGGSARPVVGPSAFVLELLGIWPASDAAQCGLDVLKSNDAWNSLPKCTDSQDCNPEVLSQPAGLESAANLLLNKHFLVSPREGFLGACFEKQHGRVNKRGRWARAGLSWLQPLPAFHLGRAVCIP